MELDVERSQRPELVGQAFDLQLPEVLRALQILEAALPEVSDPDPTYNGLLDRASRLTGDARYRAYGELDVQISRDAAPMIPVAVANQATFVSARVGCIVLTPLLDLTAVCLK